MNMDIESTLAINEIKATFEDAAERTKSNTELLQAILGIARAALRRDLAAAILPQFEEMSEAYQKTLSFLREMASIQ